MAIELEQRGDVWVLAMRSGENRFNRDSIDALHAALDRVEQIDGPVALVTTGEGKFYSNGLDLDWLMSSDAGANAATFIDDVHRLLGRVLGFAGVTVAAVNGHAYAAGAMLTCAHDYVVMREDRGYWCLPEVDLGLPLSPAMYGVVASRLAGAGACATRCSPAGATRAPKRSRPGSSTRSPRRMPCSNARWPSPPSSRRRTAT